MCLNMTDSGVIDGCGADFSAMEQNSWSAHTVPRIAAELKLDNKTAAAWAAGHRQMMRDTTTALGDGLLIAKDFAELGDHANAVLQEGCSATNNTIVMLRGLAAKAKALGRRLVYQCHISAPDETGNVPAFLIGAGVDHYLTTGGWTGVANGARGHWYSPLFERPLGHPLGDAIYHGDTDTWTRAFESGTHVSFNARTRKGEISWSGGPAPKPTPLKPCDASITVPGYHCYQHRCASDTPGFRDGDCGSDLCWPSAPDPRVCGVLPTGTPGETRAAAAARCSAHPNCTTFAVLGDGSSRDVKYFTVGVGGLLPDRSSADWTAYVAVTDAQGDETFGEGSAVSDAQKDTNALQCVRDIECSLNGCIVNGKCACRAGWTGSDCGVLKLGPVTDNQIGSGRVYPSIHANTSSWGGGVIFRGGKYHLYVSEMSGHCGLATWRTNSFIRHAESDTPDGIYTPRETVLEAWGHNAMPWVTPEGYISVYVYMAFTLICMPTTRA